MTAAAIKSVSRAGRLAWPPLLHHVVKTIRTRTLFEPGQHLLIAVSGGPDSVALVSLLHRLRIPWRLTLSAVHGNYGLRGSESDGDQEFVEAFCQRLDIPLHTMQLNVQNRARGVSLQAAARDARYRGLTIIAHRCGADRIAVGHTADDQAETVLLWMLRGAGLSGLSGMPASREGIIVRPLYETRRREILAYLQGEALSFRQDSSNDKPIYLRNRIRHEIIPALQRVSPALVKALCRLADVCREDDRYLDEQVAVLSANRVDRLPDGEQRIERSFLRELPLAVQRRLIHSSLRRCSSVDQPPSLHMVELVRQAMLKKNRVSNIAIPSGSVIVEKDAVRFFPQPSLDQPHDRPYQTVPMVLSVPGTITWAATGQRIHAEQLLRKNIQETAHRKDRIMVDADRIDGPLVVRAWQPGDRFCPFGMKGRSKKLQDFFTDLKVFGGDRTRIPVVATAERIVWVVGYRQDDRSSMTGATERCVVITVDGPPAVRGVRDMERMFGKPIVTQEQMRARIREMGRQISADYAGKDLVLVGVLKGAYAFYADLARAIRIPVRVDFIVLTRSGSRSKTAVNVKLATELTAEIAGKDVLLVEDIVDSGLTAQHLLKALAKKKPRSINVCTLLSKQDRRIADVHIEYVGFTVPNQYIVGYGLDYRQKYRNLPYLAVLDQKELLGE